MGNRYTQITIEERCELARLQTAGHSIRQIAASLDRAPSTIARELKRPDGIGTHQPQGINRAMLSNGLDPIAGLDHASIAIAACATACCPGSPKVGRQSRSLAGLPMSKGHR